MKNDSNNYPGNTLRSEILALNAYHVPVSTGMVKLDAMENPYTLPPLLREEIARRVSDAELNRYPDAGASSLKQQLRAVMQVPDGIDILLGNGSDEIIQIIVAACARPGAVMLGVEPSFVMFKMIAAFNNMTYVGVPLRDDFTLDIERILVAISEHRPALIFLAYPNNPTGNLFDATMMSRIIEAAPGLVVVDEAYHVFAEASFINKLDDCPNLLVMRTLSKLGLAGLRLGFLLGRSEWLSQLDKVRLPYNVNILTQIVAQTVLEHESVLLKQAGAIKSERSQVLAALQAMSGITAYPTDANFILFRVKNADAIFAGLKQRGILIKNLNNGHPLLADCLRVTIGTPDENRQFLQALSQST